MQIVLKGFHPEFGYMEQYFVPSERETAISIALIWQDKGYAPSLYKTWNGRFGFINLNRMRKAA